MLFRSPRYNFNESISQSDTCFSVEDRSTSVTQVVRRNSVSYTHLDVYKRQYTSNLYIRNQTLYVHLTSAALRQELMMGREVLVRTLNQRVGATVITNIIFR